MQAKDLLKMCEYCGGPDHAIGLCHTVSAVEYRSGEVVKRVEFKRGPSSAASQTDWLDARKGIDPGLTATSEYFKATTCKTDRDWADILEERRRECNFLRSIGIHPVDD